VGCRR